MGVYAIGVDFAEVERIEALIEQHGERFLQRVFTEHEIQYCRKKSIRGQCFAARFAAKEAVLKAAGTGVNQGLHWRDIEVQNDPLGKPFVKLGGHAAAWLQGKRIHLSLSHVEQMAIAMVVVEDGNTETQPLGTKQE